MASVPQDRQRHPHGLGDVINDQSVRALFEKMRRDLAQIHTDVSVVESEIDFRAEYGDEVICRVVPYRELLHVHVGANPTWEARIRSETAYADVMERVVGVFLRCISAPADNNALS